MATVFESSTLTNLQCTINDICTHKIFEKRVVEISTFSKKPLLQVVS